MFWFNRKTHYTQKDLNKYIDKNTKTVFNELNNNEVKESAGYTKNEIDNMNKSTFKLYN